MRVLVDLTKFQQQVAQGKLSPQKCYSLTRPRLIYQLLYKQIRPMHNASYCKSLRATDGYYQHSTIAGWKDQLNSWAAVLSTPCIHGNSSLICSFNHSFQSLSLFMSLTFTLTVNGKHLHRLPGRKELCSPGTSCAPFWYCTPVFLPTYQLGTGNRVGETGVLKSTLY